MCSKRIVTPKYRHISVCAITLNAIKTLSTGLTIHPPQLKIKKKSEQMVLSRLPWPAFLINFSLNPPWECKELRDVAP